jgi:hypothetical protein
VAERREANRGCATGSCDVVARLRELMAQALRSSGKFPDVVDGRYTLTFMFTQVLLRSDAQPGFLGLPYDARG